MMTRRKLRGLAILPLVVWGAACSDTATEPVDEALEAQVNLDVANYVTDMTADDISMMDLYSGMVMSSPALTPPFGFGDLTISRQVTFYGETGNEQDYFSRDTTEAIRFLFHMEGSHARASEYGTLEVSVMRDRDMWLSNLLDQETERIWNGTGSSEKSRVRHSDDDGDRSYDMSSSSKVDSVIVPVPRTWDSWPTYGTITREVHVVIVTPEGETIERDRIAVLEFNGTQFVTLTVNGTDIFEVDLARWRCWRKRDR
jgi:hypothetical protein